MTLLGCALSPSEMWIWPLVIPIRSGLWGYPSSPDSRERQMPEGQRKCKEPVPLSRWSALTTAPTTLFHGLSGARCVLALGLLRLPGCPQFY